MRFVFSFPDIGEGIAEGKIVEWYVEKGMSIKSGDPVVQMETDKVVTDIPSPKGGTVVSRFGREGDTVHVGDSLIELDIPEVSGKDARRLREDAEREAAEGGKSRFEAVKEGENGVVGTLEVAGDSAYLPSSSEGTAAESGETAGENAGGEKTGRTDRKSPATPVARAAAKNLGVDINRVHGTGPAGRVTKRDVEDAAKHGIGSDADRRDGNKPAMKEGPRVELEELSQIRKAIAARMMTSRSQTAFMSVFEEVEISRLRETVSAYKAEYKEKGINLTMLSFIVKAVSRALTEHPLLNSELDTERNILIKKKYVNMGIAVDTDEGLVVPVIRDTDTKSIVSIAHEIGIAAKKARERELTMEDMKEGTFSVSNYGPIGGLFATPIINYPQAAILGIGRADERPVIQNGEVVPGIILPLSLTADHRIVDGGEAARFLNSCMKYLSDPMRMILEE